MLVGQSVGHLPAPVILVVESQTPVRRLEVKALTDAGFTVLEAADATRGRELLRTFGDSVVLAIIDMVTPGTGGLDLANELERAHSGVKVLFTSRHLSNLVVDGLAWRFPEHLLVKPFSERELIDHVTALL